MKATLLVTAAPRRRRMSFTANVTRTRAEAMYPVNSGTDIIRCLPHPGRTCRRSGRAMPYLLGLCYPAGHDCSGGGRPDGRLAPVGVQSYRHITSERLSTGGAKAALDVDQNGSSQVLRGGLATALHSTAGLTTFSRAAAPVRSSCSRSAFRRLAIELHLTGAPATTGDRS